MRKNPGADCQFQHVVLLSTPKTACRPLPKENYKAKLVDVSASVHFHATECGCATLCGHMEAVHSNETHWQAWACLWCYAKKHSTPQEFVSLGLIPIIRQKTATLFIDPSSAKHHPTQAWPLVHQTRVHFHQAGTGADLFICGLDCGLRSS